MKINIETNYKKAVNTFNKNQLSEELHNYIINNCYFTSIKNKITLNIKGINNIEEQEKIKEVIHSYYQNKYNILKRIDNMDNYIRFIMFIIGIIAILISKELDKIFSEIFLIAGWVIIWEIIYDILFNELKRKKMLKFIKI
ncbi:MAG: hypothetical protein NC483_04405 [Ruminococcus sp.]|nr:hypothetical protein [Ruminococcus sp.]